MLVLTRKHNESARVDLRRHGLGFVDVTVIAIRGDKVRLGFDALPEVGINRMEVWEAIERQYGRVSEPDEPTELYEEGGDAAETP